MPTEPRKQQVFSITTAAESQSADRGRRERRYAISMGIRTVCFIGGVIVLTAVPSPWSRLGWILFVGAVFLPYTSVVLANSGVRKKGSGPSPFGPEAKGQIEPPAAPPLDRE
ncbi:DUF3099 domain-containing protein [Aeromicrobium ginsengisoli]|uniref:DUF3099 domain-containing protein n=1 Tax=Aeromicrobium ginsengisoli TaxID=363867 RepID=A0A5M4FH55_9ACTN|nr:DUF3099 domain-containing protein [Aeromicrobium ginsengisoli]KAA1399504.1 DUF3099 domain-containing protein [Aeromicrobium ginsengisoli]